MDDDTSLFSTVYNVTESANWKMLSNPDVTKQEQEVIFSHKNTMLNHPTIFFDETSWNAFR